MLLKLFAWLLPSKDIISIIIILNVTSANDIYFDEIPPISFDKVRSSNHHPLPAIVFLFLINFITSYSISRWLSCWLDYFWPKFKLRNSISLGSFLTWRKKSRLNLKGEKIDSIIIGRWNKCTVGGSLPENLWDSQTMDLFRIKMSHCLAR